VRSAEVVSLDLPIVDFNGDGAFDVPDLVTVIESWGQDEPTIDFWRDGTVDARDLEILMDCWEKDVNDPTLLNHWALDETEGEVACDSTDLADAILVGEPAWQPEAGVLAGALALDGQDDCLVVNSVLNPADGPFSLLVWVKGGLAGQAIVSQADGENWLCVNAVTGCLMTELKGAGRLSHSLCSETVVTDGKWHRIALVWNGANRALYVDDAVVAEDTQAGGPGSCSGGLNIGYNKTMAPGSFFSGLIDEICLYSRAVKP